MAESYMPVPQIHEDISCPSEASTEPAVDNLIVLETYRQERIQQEILQSMAESAFQLCNDDTLDCSAVYTSESDDGSILTHFIAYERGPARSNYSVPHFGWSGPETYRVITVSYDKASSQIDAHELHPRNIRYVQSDIRAQERDRENRKSVRYE